jgi:hypothetical protein
MSSNMSTISTSLTVGGSMILPSAPVLVARDSSSSVTTSKFFIPNQIILHKNGIYSASQPSRVTFPVTGTYVISVQCSSSAALLSALVTLGVVMTLTEGGVTASSTIGSLSGTTALSLIATTQIYVTAGSYATFASNTGAAVVTHSGAKVVVSLQQWI